MAGINVISVWNHLVFLVCWNCKQIKVARGGRDWMTINDARKKAAGMITKPKSEATPQAMGSTRTAARRRRSARNLAAADPTGWSMHTEYHWYRDIDGHRLDYWPSRKKWQYRGAVMSGDIDTWMAEQTRT